MRRFGHYAAVVAAFTMVLLGVRCANMNPSNTSEVGNPKLTGHLVDGRTNTPADSAIVRVYPVYLNKMAKALGKVASGAPTIDSTLTDHNGLYQFDNLANGIYSIEGEKVDAADTLSARHPSVLFIGTLDLGYDTLQLPGSIKGKIIVPGGESAKNITCYIPGTSYIAITNDTGVFRITGIPAGTYSLSFSSTRFNDTTLYNKRVEPAAETDIGSVTLGFDMSKNVHDVWGVFDSTSNYQAIGRIEARLSGDGIPVDSPRIYQLDWRPDVAGYSGFIYVPSIGSFWKVAVWVYDSLNHRIGAYQIPINRATGDVQFPAFNPCNGIPSIKLYDTTVNMNVGVPLRPVITKLPDDSIVSMAWDIGNTGTFIPTNTKDTLIFAPNNAGTLSCVFQVTDIFGNISSDTMFVRVAVRGLVAYWPFNETSDTILNDASGNGNTAYVHTATRVAGVSGNALSFNGTPDYAYTNNSASLNMSNQLSIECWVNVQQLESNQTVIRKENCYAFGIGAGGKLGFYVNIGGGWVGTWTLSQQTLQISTWYHISGVWDGSVLKVYVNGVADANTYAAAGTMTSNINNVYIGEFFESSEEGLNGTVDELKIYNYALSADSIAAHYHL